MLTTRVLGAIRGDTSLLVTIDTGQAVHRLLLDCGSGWSYRLPRRTVQSIEHVFISHFHVDHAIGFDVLLRLHIGLDRQVHIWGPERTAEFIQHRLRGYVWNLVADSNLSFCCHDVSEAVVTSRTFLCREGFAQAHDVTHTPHNGPILDEPDFRVRAAVLDHGIPVLAVAVEEPERLNVDTDVLDAKGWRPGPWLQHVKNVDQPDSDTVDVDGSPMQLGDVRRQLLNRTVGRRVAFVTDTILDVNTEERVETLARGVDTLFCEASFLEVDRNLADTHHHMTARQVGRLARRLDVGQLVLVHPSDRYPSPRLLVKEASKEFRCVDSAY
jgi:ribonuclease Z